jgi:hypothetical protein
MRARARETRSRAAIQLWQFRQRNLAAGVWYRLRRVLADAREAYVVSADEIQVLLGEGYLAEPAGRQLEPPKTIVFAEPARVRGLASRRSIRVALDHEFLTASSIVLVPFDRDPRLASADA